MRRAVFLDRDGVINLSIIKEGKPYPPANLGELVIPEATRPALERLRQAGFVLIVVTNQPDVGRGTQSLEMVLAIHEELKRNLPLDAIYYCTDDKSPDYKPQPGMLLKAAQDWQIDLAQSFMIGDRWRDVGAGQNAGCSSIFIDYGYNEKKPSPPFIHVKSLPDAVSWIMDNPGQ